MKWIFTILSCIFLVAGTPEDINNALKLGDASALKNYMNETVELALPNAENVYSKTQAEQILKRFFNQNKPVSFKLLHNGVSDQSQYYIGELRTSETKFRVYYLVKQREGNLTLFQLRIEKDE